MSEPEVSELLPSIVQILKRAGALEHVPGGDIQAVSRLPVFQGRAWRRSIGEFLRWSGSTPDVWGNTSIFELLLCHGGAGARSLFDAYRHDRLERAASFEEAEAQLEAVRTVVSMASYWLHVVEWDLRDAPRLTAEEFHNWRRGRLATASAAESRERAPRDRIERLLTEDADVPGRGRPSTAGVPVFPNESAAPSLWKDVPDKTERPVTPATPGPRPRPTRT